MIKSVIRSMIPRRILLLFVVASGMSVNAQYQYPDTSQSRNMPTREQYVFLPLFKGFNPFKRKTTSTKMIDESVTTVEQILQAYHHRCEHKDDALRDSLQQLGENQPSSVFAAVDLERAYRQYACGIDKRGDVLVYLNGFCQIDHMPHWRSEWIFFHDGGPCYFQAVVNVTQRRIEMLRVNGFA